RRRSEDRPCAREVRIIRCWESVEVPLPRLIDGGRVRGPTEEHFLHEALVDTEVAAHGSSPGVESRGAAVWARPTFLGSNVDRRLPPGTVRGQCWIGESAVRTPGPCGAPISA